MKSTIRSAIRRFEEPFRTHLRESPARSRGDAARDAGRISEAADAYREHLAQYPRDFAIWVQLGHMLKDTKRPIEADYAYGRALDLRADDADLLLHYGSLKRVLRKPKKAAKLFEQCADIRISPALIAEMTAPDVVEFISAHHKRQIAAITSRGVADKLEGLTLIDCGGIYPLEGDRVRLVNDDPYICMSVDAPDDSGPLMGLHIVFEAEDERRPPVGRLYLDYGDGYVHPDSFALSSGLGDRTFDTVVALASPKSLRSIRYDPDDKTNTIRIKRVALMPSVDIEEAFAELAREFPPEIDIEADVRRARSLLQEDTLTGRQAMFVNRLLAGRLRTETLTYEFWRRRWIDPNRADYDRIAEMTAALPRRPTFSFVMPVYNTPIPLLQECLESILNQTYQDFEVCIADDRSPNPAVVETIERYARRDPRIKLARRAHNGHISAASNSALAMATGEFVVLMDHDDLIPDYCLFTVAHYINAHPEGHVFFSDEDKITINGERFEPYFKGIFDPFLMYGHNMVSHLGVYRRQLLEDIGGFRLGLEGSQDYDLLLRSLEHVGEDAIVHIPHVLYHWRAIPGSTAVSADQKSYAIVAAGAAINGHFERTKAPLRSIPGFAPGLTALRPVRESDTLISIVIPTRDHGDDLQACIESIQASDHAHSEIIIIDNGTEDAASLAYLESLRETGVAKVIVHDAPFNFSEINNIAAEHAVGDILCFLNNDTEVLSEDWLMRARALLDMPGVGMVGARLLYPDGALQHFGIHTGVAAHGVAGTPHGGNPKEDAGYFGKARLMQQFSAVTAACMFVRAEVFHAAGGFDPALRVAYNDVDLCLKVRKAGYKIVGDPDILLIHKESRTRGLDTGGERAARLNAEAALMRERWGDTLVHDPFYSSNHCLERGDFALAHPPRVPVPWRLERPRVRQEPPARVVPAPPPPPWVEEPAPPQPVIRRFDDLPPVVSPAVLRRRYFDLAHLDDAGLLAHYEEWGRTEGRQAADVADRGGFLQMIDRDARLLEIGPYFNPHFSGDTVQYLDVFDAETLRERAVEAGQDPSLCPKVIHHTNGLGELAGAGFDAIFSSHAIEHQPDLVRHLREVADALAPGAMYWLMIPDKRYCFDRQRPTSTISDVLDAHIEGRTRNAPRTVIDHFVMSDHNDPVRHWRGQHDDVAVKAHDRLKSALEHIDEHRDDYIDVHAWQFTPDSFRSIIATLAELKMIPFTRARVYDTPLNQFEFMAVLARDE